MGVAIRIRKGSDGGDSKVRGGIHEGLRDLMQRPKHVLATHSGSNGRRYDRTRTVPSMRCSFFSWAGRRPNQRW